MNCNSYMKQKMEGGKKLAIKEISQEEVRQKLIQKLEEGQQQYIAKQVGIPKQILSNFKTGKRQLWDSSLEALNNYLDNH